MCPPEVCIGWKSIIMLAIFSKSSTGCLFAPCKNCLKIYRTVWERSPIPKRITKSAQKRAFTTISNFWKSLKLSSKRQGAENLHPSLQRSWMICRCTWKGQNPIQPSQRELETYSFQKANPFWPSQVKKHVGSSHFIINFIL